MHWLTLAPLLTLVSAAAPASEKRFMVTGFDRLRVDGPFRVEVLPGSPRAVASGDAKALDHIAIRVDGSTLVVNMGTVAWKLRAIEAPEAVTITVYVPLLRTLTVNGGASVKVAEMRGGRVDLGLNGAGAIQVSAIRADDLNVTLTGTGEVTLAGATARARVRSYGAGSVAAEGLTAGDAVLIAESSGNLTMRVRYTAQVSALGVGAVAVLGNPKCRVSGAGPVACGDR
ncbi:head GIN domain-containing protein [Sphingomonas sp.]|jgi:hypothetical protein|uniref:head GIN domain-containing protein n=1 Tax=Sphingomonas sp. TaxID=28214 RepID=UPI002EDAC167